ncbi:ABC transporter substrate-binding protein [soil metagenome]
MRSTTRRRLLAGSAALPLAMRFGRADAQGSSQLRLGMSADISSMDPHWLNASSNAVVTRHVFDYLIDQTAAGQLVPSLARSWRPVDSTTWEFKLRNDVRWHDGTPFTSEDVAFSITRPKLLTQTPAGFASFVRAVESIQIVDRETIRFKVSTPDNAWFPDDLSNTAIIQKKACEKAEAQGDFDNGRAMIGTGPFKFVRFARGDRVELVRNPDYWGGPSQERPTFEKVTLRVLTQNSTRVAALLAGEVDAIENVPVQDLANMRKNAAFAISQRVSWRTIFFHMDQYREVSPFIWDNDGKPLARNPFMDIRVRTAIDKAINRTALCERVMDGLGIPSANLLSPGVLGHNPALKPEAYDPDGARKLLADAGYPNGFSLALHSPNNRYINDEQVAQTVAGMLARIGIKTRVDGMPQAIYFPRANRAEFSFSMIGWGSLIGDSSIRHQFGTYDEKQGWGGYNNGRGSFPELDAVLRRARSATDPKTRSDLAIEASALVQKNRQGIFLYHQVVTWALRRGLTYPGRLDEYMLAPAFKAA